MYHLVITAGVSTTDEGVSTTNKSVQTITYLLVLQDRRGLLQLHHPTCRGETSCVPDDPCTQRGHPFWLDESGQGLDFAPDDGTLPIGLRDAEEGERLDMVGRIMVGR